MNSRWRKLLAALALALALVAAHAAWRGSGREVDFVYDAPPGDLQVTLYDAQDRRVRQVWFAAGAERRHTVRLPEGPVTARLRLGDRQVERTVEVGPADTVRLSLR